MAKFDNMYKIAGGFFGAFMVLGFIITSATDNGETSGIGYTWPLLCLVGAAFFCVLGFIKRV